MSVEKQLVTLDVLRRRFRRSGAETLGETSPRAEELGWPDGVSTVCCSNARWSDGDADPVCLNPNRTCSSETMIAALLEDGPPPTGAVAVPFTEITAKPIRWLWSDRIALGKLTAWPDGQDRKGVALLGPHRSSDPRDS